MSRPQSFVLVNTIHGPLIVNRLDYHVNRLGETYGVGSQLFQYGEYEVEEVKNIKNFLTSLHDARGGGVVALDIGANIGVHTVEMAKHMYEWGEVIAFEPQLPLYHCLCGNVVLALFRFSIFKFWSTMVVSWLSVISSGLD